ncbi:hypothetical protein [Couchioplanes caeruleus]|uniref:Uncharacterized protein n=2 Tax=Couchioplanes caeruleus TaxID=56438 RepID=A0A1K0GDV3_9ACTN|nr:hypothetical protein [Couchioplanes caeruleus]OJF10326.1 hypothetical protein BG844_32645 [Couchioplanes caeruleus subsp. caeruleus]ROP30024.1 hypothetical protein EDD30_2855 [Couchioplanes caeruleus]
MTSTPPPQPEPARPVLPVLRPLRDLAAYALVAAPAVWLFVAIIRLVPSGVGQDFLTRAQNSFYSYINVETILLPLAAVLLATLVTPRHRNARLITVVALVEYAVAAFFAVLFGFLIAIVKLAGFSVRVAFEELLVRVAWLAVFAVAAYAVFSIWRALFHTPKPAPQPGMYGQPPQQWGQQPQPGFAPPGQPHPGQPHPGQPYPGQPYPGQPQPGQPYPGAQQQAWGQPSGWGQPTAAHPQAQPAPGSSAPPASAPPASAPPASAPPAQPGPGLSDPTQTIAARDTADDRTQIVGEDPNRTP